MRLPLIVSGVQNSTTSETLAKKIVWPQRTGLHANKVRDARCAEHSPADQRQGIGADVDRHHAIALHHRGNISVRRNAVGKVDNAGTTETDIVVGPDPEIRQPGER